MRLKNHKVAVLFPGLFGPLLSQAVLGRTVGIIAVVALCFNQNKVALFGVQDKIGIMVGFEPVDGEAFAPAQITVPEFHRWQRSQFADNPFLETVHASFALIQGSTNGLAQCTRHNCFSERKALSNRNFANQQQFFELFFGVFVGQGFDLLTNLIAVAVLAGQQILDAFGIKTADDPFEITLNLPVGNGVHIPDLLEHPVGQIFYLTCLWLG